MADSYLAAVLAAVEQEVPESTVRANYDYLLSQARNARTAAAEATKQAYKLYDELQRVKLLRKDPARAGHWGSQPTNYDV